MPSLDVKAFDDDITNLIKRVGGLQARDFQVVGFVGELFVIQHKHGIYGTNQFTLTILSLLVFEGVAKQRFPDLNFQQESVPFVSRVSASQTLLTPSFEAFPKGSNSTENRLFSKMGLDI